MTLALHTGMPRHGSWSLEEQVLRETAFHEAGHAVLAKLSGTYLVGAIDACPSSTQGAFDGAFQGDLHLAREMALGVRVDPVAENAVICAAGAVAQAKFMCENRIGLDENGKWTLEADDHVWNCAAGDAREVRRMLGTGKWREVTAEATMIFDNNGVWRAVENLAAEVIRRKGRMPGAAVDDFLHQVFFDLNLPAFQALTGRVVASSTGKI